MEDGHVHEAEVRERIRRSSTVNFMIGTFFTVITGIFVYKGVYLPALLFIPLVIAGIWKLWKEGEFSGEGAIGGIFFFFVIVPLNVYMMIDIIQKGIYSYPIIIGLIFLPGILQAFRDFINDVKGK